MEARKSASGGKNVKSKPAKSLASVVKPSFTASGPFRGESGQKFKGQRVGFRGGTQSFKVQHKG